MWSVICDEVVEFVCWVIVDFLFVAVTRFLCGVLWVCVYALYVLVRAHLDDFLYVLVYGVVGYGGFGFENV